MIQVNWGGDLESSSGSNKKHRRHRRHSVDELSEEEVSTTSSMGCRNVFKSLCGARLVTGLADRHPLQLLIHRF